MDLTPKGLPESVWQALRDTFDARLDYEVTQDGYIGRWPPTLQIGTNEYVKVGEIELAAWVDKAELELHRPLMVADYLLSLDRDTARDYWQKATLFEGEQFMKRLRVAVEDVKKRKGLL